MNPETPPPNTENKQPSNLVGGGMKIIQPTAPNVTPDNSTTSPQSQATPPSNPLPIDQPQTNPQPTVSNPPAMSVNGQSVPQVNYDPTQFSEKPRRHWFRWVSLFVLVLLIVGAGAILATNQNIRATVFRQKFVTYNYPLCKTHTCTIKFYRDSKIAPYTPPTPPGQTPLTPSMTLISPVMENKTYIIMRVDALKLNSTTEQLLNDQYNNCTEPGETTGFTEYLPNLDTSANICAIASNGLTIGYRGAFASQKVGALFDVIISENFTFNAQGQVLSSSFFDLSNYQSDMQSILASLNVKS